MGCPVSSVDHLKFVVYLRQRTARSCCHGIGCPAIPSVLWFYSLLSRPMCTADLTFGVAGAQWQWSGYENICAMHGPEFIAEEQQPLYILYVHHT